MYHFAIIKIILLLLVHGIATSATRKTLRIPRKLPYSWRVFGSAEVSQGHECCGWRCSECIISLPDICEVCDDTVDDVAQMFIT